MRRWYHGDTTLRQAWSEPLGRASSGLAGRRFRLAQEGYFLKRGLTYIGLAFLISWSWWLPMALTGTITRPGQAWPTHLPGLLGPGVAAVITTARFDGVAGVRVLWSRVTRWRLHWGWYLTIGATAAMILLPLATGKDIVGSDFVTYSGAGQWGVFTVLYVLLLNGFGEEIGWRGFLVEAMMQGHSLIDAAVRIWIVWGLWHLPLFFIVQNFRDLGIGGFIGWALGLLSGSVWLAWMYTEGHGSILLVALWHTAFNFATATTAGAGVSAAVASSIVMVASVVIALPKASRLGPEAR